MKRERYHAHINDSGEEMRWLVLDPEGLSVAKFDGKHAKQYAIAHARMLNALPEEDQP